ncbi:hypothetical protein M8C21_027462 [Ambrosia artemisiifolia]|uniref:E2 ubiquitin-conjugating enzyme n=1 Tax=Ambrosia artemisiifolia TaxID=4212 RepID=A0AAD5C4X1_AMBAR|nr:hypothetical protein M8C21_027462 [Ambrosia artemisiifolia]
MESKKRLFWGSSSSSAEPEVIEIAPPLVNRTSNAKAKGKQKVAYHEIIDVDLDEDCDDVVLLEGMVGSNKRAKFGMGTSSGSSSAVKSDSKKVESNKKGKEIQVDPGHYPKDFNPGTNNFFDLDDYVFDNEYGAFQSHFYDKGLLAGTEVHVPFVTSRAQLEASVSKPNRVDPLPASNMFSSSKKSTAPPKNWAKKIQEEWKILDKDLPDTIFVRVYESRMDLLRAVIIGAEGTPYHDGLFFFDVCFPSSYPNTPPLVHYHSGGLRINPNLYNCGKVCLSLLNTWTGVQNEKWVPGTSTMLQVLVSIQGLILNMKPYFNEPGYAHSSGSAHGEKSSLQYNERTFILSLKTMVYTMKKPPKNFEDLVIGHFKHRVRDILMACKAYTEGVQVGCLVKGGVQDVDEGGNSCSAKFKHDVCSYIKTLVAAFKKIGAKEAQEFLSLSDKETSLRAAAAAAPAAPGPGLIPTLHSYKPTNPSYYSHGHIPFPKQSISAPYKHAAAYKQHW